MVDFRCTFCGRARKATRDLVAGPGLFICDACVLTCIDLAPGGAAEATRGSWFRLEPCGPEPPTALGNASGVAGLAPRRDRSICSFCGKTRDDVLAFFRGYVANICSECVGLCIDIIDALRGDRRWRKGRAAWPEDVSTAGPGTTSPGDASLTERLSQQYGVPAIFLGEFAVEPDVIQLISPDVARKHRAIPINVTRGTLIVALADPNDAARKDLQRITGLRVEVVAATEHDLDEALAKYYPA